MVIGAMLYIDWSLTLVVLPIPVLMATGVRTSKVPWTSQQVAKINEFVQEHVTGMHIVQAFNRKQVEAEAFEINAAHREANIRSIGLSACSSPWWKC